MITAETPKGNLEDEVGESESTKPKIPRGGNHEGNVRDAEIPKKSSRRRRGKRHRKGGTCFKR